MSFPYIPASYTTRRVVATCHTGIMYIRYTGKVYKVYFTCCDCCCALTQTYNKWDLWALLSSNWPPLPKCLLWRLFVVQLSGRSIDSDYTVTIGIVYWCLCTETRTFHEVVCTFCFYSTLVGHFACVLIGMSHKLAACRQPWNEAVPCK